MPSYTRRQLKQDKFVTFTAEQVHWTVEHRKSIITALVIAAIVLLAVLGGGAYMSSQEEKASLGVGEGVTLLTSQIHAADAPPIPNETTFPTEHDRAKAAHEKFIEVARAYPRTRNGKYALYMAGVTARDLGDNNMAEQHLKEAGDSGNQDVASLAKFALAGLYRDTGKPADAIRLYKEVADANSGTVPRLTAQLTLAEMYEPKQPLDALKVYQQIKQEAENEQKAASKDKKAPAVTPGAPPENAAGVAQQIATSKIAELEAKTKK